MYEERCLHSDVCKYGKNRTSGMYCTGERCLHFKDRAKWVKKKDTVTNADRIRAMSDEELAEFLESTHSQMAIKLGGEYIVREKEYIGIWLKQPAEE